MKPVAKFFTAFLVVIVALLLIGLGLSSTYRVERSATVAAKPEKIFPLVNSLKRWPEWSAWTTNRFPDMTTTYTGPEAGVGAESAWSGKSSGHGKMKLTQADPAKGIGYDLDFEEGKYPSTGSMTFEVSGDSTKIVWVSTGKISGPVGGWMGLLMERFMGPDMEAGLKTLKEKVEAK